MSATTSDGARIEVRGLTKRFGSFVAVDDLSFDVEPGRITGFLGPNGAGKTTSLRMILGLVNATSGTATIDGHRYVDLPNPLGTVGAALEATNFHPGRSGRDHLRVLADAGSIPLTRVDELLELTGIPAAARKRAGEYSMGMRQRLGLAAALLGDPKVLVLDEPSNGLDPEGIRWLRTLLREIADGGGTVIISSHLLSEIEQVADRLLVINGGAIVADGSAAELLAAGPTTSTISVTATDPHALAAAFERAGIFWQYAPDGTTFQAKAEAAAVGAAALEGGVVLTRLEPQGGIALEDLFLSLTTTDQPNAGTPS